MTVRRFAVLATSGLLLLAGCAVEGSPDASGDPLEDGRCVDGQDVTISDSSVVNLTGDCGTVVVTGDAQNVNVATAEQIVVEAGVSVLGDDWGSVIVEAEGVFLNVETIGTAYLNADGVRVNNTEIRELRIKGDGVTVNNTTVGVAVLRGDDSVIVSGTIDRLEVYGDRNTVNWTGGTSAPEVDEGDGNTLNR